MNNYNNGTSFIVEKGIGDSKYIICRNDQQELWIKNVARKAAKLMSEQIKKTAASSNSI